MNNRMGIAVRIGLLPVQLQRELNLPGSPLKQQRRARGCDDSCGRVADLRGRIVELRCVECVERFRTELKMRRLCEIELLEYRQIELFGSRPKEYIPARVAECIVSGRDEVGGVEPSLDTLIFKLPRSDTIWPLS